MVALTAAISAYFMQSLPLVFTSVAFFLTFLGTFIVNKSPSGHTVIQKSGSKSRSTQTVIFGNNERFKDK